MLIVIEGNSLHSRHKEHVTASKQICNGSVDFGSRSERGSGDQTSVSSLRLDFNLLMIGAT